MNNAHPARIFRHWSSVNFVQSFEFTYIFIHKLMVTCVCRAWMLLANERQKNKISRFLLSNTHKLAISLFQLFLLGFCDSVFLFSPSPPEACTKATCFTTCCAATGYLHVLCWSSRNLVVAGKPGKQHWARSCLWVSKSVFGLQFLPLIMTVFNALWIPCFVRQGSFKVLVCFVVVFNFLLCAAR